MSDIGDPTLAVALSVSFMNLDSQALLPHSSSFKSGLESDGICLRSGHRHCGYKRIRVLKLATYNNINKANNFPKFGP